MLQRKRMVPIEDVMVLESLIIYGVFVLGVALCGGFLVLLAKVITNRRG